MFADFQFQSPLTYKKLRKKVYCTQLYWYKKWFIQCSAERIMTHNVYKLMFFDGYSVKYDDGI